MPIICDRLGGDVLFVLDAAFFGIGSGVPGCGWCLWVVRVSVVRVCDMYRGADVAADV